VRVAGVAASEFPIEILEAVAAEGVFSFVKKCLSKIFLRQPVTINRKLSFS
jgi:hypothetical protein